MNGLYMYISTPEFRRTFLRVLIKVLWQQYAPRDKSASRLGYSDAKPEQREAVRATSTASGLNAFIALPTGYGKSVCYALLFFVFDKLYSLPHHTSVVLSVMNLSTVEPVFFTHI